MLSYDDADWLKSIILLAIYVSSSIGCDEVSAKLDVHLIGTGFHGKVSVTANLTSKSRLVNCNAIYAFKIPDGAFVDIDELHQTFDTAKRKTTHCFTVTHYFNVERAAVSKPSENSQERATVYFYSNKSVMKAFELIDQFEFPIHFRYQRPRNYGKEQQDTGFTLVELPGPSLFLRCEDGQWDDDECERQFEKLPCSCNQKTEKNLCPSLHIKYPLPREPAARFIPFGNKDNIGIVIGMTFITILSYVIFVVREILRLDKKKI